MSFASREDAGRKLGQYLAGQSLAVDLVLGLPRGGVVVAAEVARCLQCPLDVLVVRKIGHPNSREFAVGALAEGDVVVLDEAVLKRARVDPKELDTVVAEEGGRLQSYQQRFARANRPSRFGKVVVIIDDGLATGATLEAAVRSARKEGALQVNVGVPVASTAGAARISRICDQFHALLTDPGFEAVGQYYASFGQTTDDEVRDILAQFPQ
jgi:predicted phosphoribosyltransferase